MGVLFFLLQFGLGAVIVIMGLMMAKLAFDEVGEVLLGPRRQALGDLGLAGRATVEGVIEDAPLSAPLTGRGCACWKARVRWSEQGNDQEVVHSGRAPFWIVDADGRRARVALTDEEQVDDIAEQTVTGTYVDGEPAVIRGWLKDVAWSETPEQGRWEEWILAPGQAVVVIGSVGQGRGESKGYRDSETVPVLEGPLTIHVGTVSHLRKERSLGVGCALLIACALLVVGSGVVVYPFIYGAP